MTSRTPVEIADIYSRKRAIIVAAASQIRARAHRLRMRAVDSAAIVAKNANENIAWPLG